MSPESELGSPRSVSVAPKTAPGQVQHDETHHDRTDDGEEDLESQGKTLAGRLAARIGKPLLEQPTSVASSAPWLEHRQCRDDEQHKYGEASIAYELGSQPADVGQRSWRGF